MGGRVGTVSAPDIPKKVLPGRLRLATAGGTVAIWNTVSFSHHATGTRSCERSQPTPRPTNYLTTWAATGLAASGPTTPTWASGNRSTTCWASGISLAGCPAIWLAGDWRKSDGRRWECNYG